MLDTEEDDDVEMSEDEDRLSKIELLSDFVIDQKSCQTKWNIFIRTG